MKLLLKNQHYNAIRSLVEHGAKTSLSSVGRVKSPLTELVSQSNARLDLFDLIATRELNDRSLYRFLPLHEAVRCGNTNIALHLIKLGASVNQEDGHSRLPVHYILESCALKQFDSELFERVLPSKNMDILKVIGEILKEKENSSKTAAYTFQMLHRSLQRLHFDEPLNVQMPDLFFSCMLVNGVVIVSPGAFNYFLCIDLCSLLLVELQFQLASMPNKVADELLESNARIEYLVYARAIDSLWKQCRVQRVRSLLRQCILQIRSCMSSLDDDSFLCLPVPPYIRGLLTYHDVSEKIFAEWCKRTN